MSIIVNIVRYFVWHGRAMEQARPEKCERDASYSRGPSPTRIRETLRRENPGVHRVGDLLTLFLESALKRSWPRYAEVDLEIADWKVLLRTLEAPETRQWILLSALSLIIITHRRSTHRRLER